MPVRDSGAEVDQVSAVKAWAQAAHELLVEAAASGTTVDYPRLARTVQQRSGIATKQPTAKWLGPLLGVVARQCQAHQLPLLTALAVRRDGTVGPVYDEILRFAHIPAVVDDREAHAEQQRRACFARWKGAAPAAAAAPATAVAAGSRRPTVVGKVPPAAKAPARSRTKPEPLQGNVCPRCFMQMSLTGVCDNCD